MINTDNKEKLKEHISPEGVEERIIKQTSSMMTQTAGGKFRLYADGRSQGVFDTQEEAQERYSSILGLMAMLEIDPEKTIKTVVDGLKGKRND